MEKLEIENVKEVIEPVTEAEKAVVEPVEEIQPKEYSKWLKDEQKWQKTCEKCGAVMRGWAYRENFKYCPMCGVEMR